MTDMWSARLSEHVDNELDETERAELDVHLGGCEPCRVALEELRAVATRARALEDRDPPRDLWPDIHGRIQSSKVVPLAVRRPGRSRVFTFSAPQLAAAAAVVAMLGAGAMWWFAPRASVESTSSAGPVMDGIVAPAAATADEPAITTIIDELQHVLEEHRGQLDTATVHVLEDNLATIDRAIAEVRAALLADPASQFLNAHLAETLRLKVQLLRRAASLVTSAG